MNTSSRRLRFGVIVSVLMLAGLILTALPISQFQAAAIEPVSELWRIAPPAPKISEGDRLNELANRRQEAMKRMGDKAIAVLFSTEPRIYTYDVDYHYRQENNLYYLTGIKLEGATLVLIPGAKKTREILFMPERNPRAETWTGKMMSQSEARERSGVREVWDSKLLNGL
jgi:Xaa-Pro aminopeptidase